MRKRRNAELEAELAVLRSERVVLETSDSFGCLTRNALKLLFPKIDPTHMSMVYFDLDGLKQANSLYGKPEIGRRVTTVMTQLRSSDIVIGQWFSGDEFIAIVPQVDAIGFATRFQARLHDQQLSATFVTMQLTSRSNLFERADYGEQLVSIAKDRGLRDRIFTQEELEVV